MINVEKIFEDLYFLKYVHREGSFVGISIVLGLNKIGLVDTGFEATIIDSLFPLLRELQRSPEEINLVVNTHRDGDHVKGNKLIKENTKAKIAIHELDAEAIEGIDIKLKNGDYVELGDRKFEVIHTPGHTPGSICLYQRENQLLIVGDSLVGDIVNLIRMDKSVYINSLKSLLNLDIKLLIQSHPRKPFEKAILIDEEPINAIRANISIAEKSMY